MTAPRGRAKGVGVAFDALRVEGGLLAPEWLAKIARLEAGEQGEADYDIEKGLNLRDEIGRYWRIAQPIYADLAAGMAAGADRLALSERFVRALFVKVFGFTSLAPTAPVVLGERSWPIGHSAIGRRVPVVIAPAGAGLDAAHPAFGDGLRKRSAFGLAQEYLNASQEATYALVTDGVTLRLARDNASLTRPAWIEADLGRIFAEGLFADFAALWLLIHASRFGRPDRPPSECALEAWRERGREEGTRAREHLRRGVEEALGALGQGFVSHPDNGALRAALQSGALTDRDLFNQLLRLVYRLIFLLTVEERGLLHPDGATEAARALYAEGYSLRRLRERAARRSAHDRHTDAWDGVRVVFRGLARGEVRLGLPALAGLFAPGQCLALDGARLENRALLLAVFKLAWLRDKGGLSRVNWRDMGPEELGSVYESLLELVPAVSVERRSFGFVGGDEAKGNARKTSGSYYTPDSLVQVLLDSALEPVVQKTIAANPADPVAALLSLAVVDPACGSGHFLLAAARRLAAHVARLEAHGTPSVGDYRRALRRVVGRCIYGVDLNPMAVELCKVALWMEAVEPGLPLGFLDAHIQHGNALLGATPALMAEGVPDAAFEPIEGDDKKVASALRRRNAKEAGGQTTMVSLWSRPSTGEADEVAAAVAQLDAASDADAEALARKESRWTEILASGAFRHQRFVADAWCAAFVWPKPEGGGPVVEGAPTAGLWRDIRDGRGKPPEITVRTVEALASRYRFFHWHLAFPTVFAKGGFDVVLGNPPWDSLLFREEEFFATRAPQITSAPTAARRKRMIADLSTSDPHLLAEYRNELRSVAGMNAFVRSGVSYPLCGVGRVNLFALFAERARRILRTSGRLGQILPSGITSDDSTKLFFQDIVESKQICSFFDFENRDKIFSSVDSRMKFGILILSGYPNPNPAEFMFFALQASDLAIIERRFCLTADDIRLLNPITRTCPIFRSRRDATITISVYRRIPVVSMSGWNLELRRLLNSADDSANFLDTPESDSLPLYEGKCFHHFDHRWMTSDGKHDRTLSDAEHKDATCSIRPRYWFPGTEVQTRFGAAWPKPWVLAWRDIARSTDERTFIASVVPSLAISDTAKVVFPQIKLINKLPIIIANMATFVFDYVARQKIGGTHMSAFIVEQLPLLDHVVCDQSPPWLTKTSLLSWLLPRVLELTYTAWDLEPFARDVGYGGPPFRWDPARRFLLRCELDAAFFHLYGLSRDDTGYILDTFPIVRKNDEKAHGEHRTKRVILEIYDAMAEAARSGIPCPTRLDPPPADPRVAHPPREGRC